MSSFPFVFRLYSLPTHWLNLFSCQKRINTDRDRSDGKLLEILNEPRSLLGALHPRSRFLLLVIRFLPLLLLPASHLLFYVDIVHGGLLALIQLHVRQLAPWLWWEDLLKRLALARRQRARLRELNVELDKQTTLHERTTMLRHALIIYGLVLTY